MRIMALDLAKRTGAAFGIAGEGMPRIEAVTLRGSKDPPEQEARNLGCYLRDRFMFAISRPELIVVESYMNPAASESDRATIAQLLSHGALLAIAGTYGIRVEAVASSTVRKHFCDRASAAPRRATPRTKRQKAEDREATNNMVLRRAITLGYLPHGSDDWDKASAAALYDYGCAHFARVSPRELKFFGEG